MKYGCSNCGKLIYSEKELEECKFCGGDLKDISVTRQLRECLKTGEKTGLISGIPGCDNFKLVNAPGHRCMSSSNPSKCPVAELPEYDPRVGIGGSA